MLLSTIISFLLSHLFLEPYQVLVLAPVYFLIFPRFLLKFPYFLLRFLELIHQLLHLWDVVVSISHLFKSFALLVLDFLQ